jgi:hypothetical protein
MCHKQKMHHNLFNQRKILVTDILELEVIYKIKPQQLCLILIQLQEVIKIIIFQKMEAVRLRFL